MCNKKTDEDSLTPLGLVRAQWVEFESRPLHNNPQLNFNFRTQTKKLQSNNFSFFLHLAANCNRSIEMADNNRQRGSRSARTPSPTPFRTTNADTRQIYIFSSHESTAIHSRCSDTPNSSNRSRSHYTSNTQRIRECYVVDKREPESRCARVCPGYGNRQIAKCRDTQSHRERSIKEW